MVSIDRLLSMVDEARDEIIAFEQALVRIPSVNTGFMPTGDETPVCQAVQHKLAQDGIPSEILESAPNRGNLIARLPGGRSGRPKLLYMAHTDVVPPGDESLWRFPPFSAEITEGRLWGRGSQDCKALLTCETMALILLKRAGVQLDGELIQAAGADEESGGRYGFGWLAEHHPDKIRADFAINEGGGAPVQTDKGPVYSISIGEKGRSEVHITVHGASTHAARPWRGDNALLKAAEVLRHIAAYNPERDVSAPIFRYLDIYGVTETPTVANIDRIVDEVGRRSDPNGAFLRSSSRMTFTPTMISGGIKSNSVPDRVYITCDIRSLPHQDPEYIRRQVAAVLDGMPGVEFDIDNTAIPNASPPDTGFFRQVAEASELAFGRKDIRWIPSITVGFTDSRLVRPLGVVVYNFAAANPDADPELDRAHSADESQDLRSLLTCTKMLVALAVMTLGQAS